MHTPATSFVTRIKRTNKTRTPLRTDREHFAKDAEYFRDRIRFQHKPNHFRTCILTENNPLLIVRRLTSVCCSDFVFFLADWWMFFSLGVRRDHPSHVGFAVGPLPGKTVRWDAHLVYVQNIIRDLVGFTVGLVGVSSVRWDAHLYYAGFHTSHGCIRSAGTCRVNRTVICCAVFHKSHGGALAVQNVLTKSARRDARILSPQTQQHTVHDTQSRIGHCELFRQMVCTTLNRELGIACCFAQMVCTTPNRELGIASCFAPNGVHDTQSRIGCCEPFRPMACTTLNRELGIASCFAQMVCTTPNRELDVASCSPK